MRHLVLVGLMATGKSTIGRMVGETLDRPVLDTDDEVETRAGRPVRDIWWTDGEPAFRRLETEVLSDLLGRARSSVVAAAGGVVLADENRRLLAGNAAFVVWLRARPETLARRVDEADDAHRPLLDGDPAGMLERMEHDRRAFYEDVADHVVDVDDLDAADVARAVCALVETAS